MPEINVKANKFHRYFQTLIGLQVFFKTIKLSLIRFSISFCDFSRHL